MIPFMKRVEAEPPYLQGPPIGHYTLEWVDDEYHIRMTDQATGLVDYDGDIREASQYVPDPFVAMSLPGQRFGEAAPTLAD